MKKHTVSLPATCMVTVRVCVHTAENGGLEKKTRPSYNPSKTDRIIIVIIYLCVSRGYCRDLCMG